MGVASLDLQQTDVGQGYIDYGRISNKPKINGVTLEGNLSTAELNIIIPQRVSELQNDAGYITKNVSDLIYYYDKTEVDNMISTIPKFSIKVVDALPTEDISPTTIYLLVVQGDDHFEEYIYVNGEWDKLGDGNIDLSAYATYTYVDTELAKKANVADLATVALSGRYSDLIGTPTNLSQFTNDVGYLTEVPDGSVSRAKLSSALNADLTAVENAVDGLQNSVRSLSETKADNTTVSALSDTVALKADRSELPTKTSDLTNDSNFVVDASYVHTDNNYTTAEKNKLAGIAAGAEVNVQSDWNQATTTADDYIKNKPSIPTKTSDLTNDSGFITTAAIPTNVSAFNNDAGYLNEIPDDSVGLNQLDDTIVNALNNINSKANTADLATVAFSGDYDDLTDKPTIPAAQVNSDWNASSGVAEILNKPTLAAVATSGSYTDLSSTPSIPTKTSDLTNDGASGSSTYVEASALGNYVTLGTNQNITGEKTFVGNKRIKFKGTASDSKLGFTTYDNTGGETGFLEVQGASTASKKVRLGCYDNAGGNARDNYVGFQYYNTKPVGGGTVNYNLVCPPQYKGISGHDSFAYIPIDFTDGNTTIRAGVNGILDLSPLMPSSVTVVQTTGQSTTDVMSQKAVTDELDTKADTSSLATVATTGDYSDLLNKPTIPAAQVNSDWNANSGVAQILNKPTLATVATSGLYSDLTGTPNIPIVNNATLTVTQNGTSAGTFTANASSNVTIALTDTTYSAFSGATSSAAGSAGLVPAPAAGDNTKFLAGDGTWQTATAGSIDKITNAEIDAIMGVA